MINCVLHSHSYVHSHLVYPSLNKVCEYYFPKENRKGAMMVVINFVAPVLSAAVLLAGNVRGHMIMKSPIPYNLDIAPYVQVNPLNGIGDANLPFPCQNRYDVQSVTPVEAGNTTLVQFAGGAQHGGGSCQFSISYDGPSTGGWNASAKFKTIYSIIGGCPAQFTDESKGLPLEGHDEEQRVDTKHCGNDVDKDCIRQFLVPLPAL